jgi:hypothetical protein
MRKNELPETSWNPSIVNLKSILRGQSPRGMLSPSSNKDLNAYIQNVQLEPLRLPSI